MQLRITRLVNNPHHCITWLTTQNTCHVKRQCSFWDFLAWRARRNHGSFNNIHICPKLLLSNKLFWQNKREWAQFCQSEIGIIQLILDQHVTDPLSAAIPWIQNPCISLSNWLDKNCSKTCKSNPFHTSNSPSHKKEHIASSGSNQFVHSGEGLETRLWTCVHAPGNERVWVLVSQFSKEPPKFF